MKAYAVTSLALLLGACSLLQAPDRSRIASMDASVPDDADAEAEVLMDADADAPMDAGDSCPDAGCPMDEVCDDGMDNDLDGLTDCNDFDCTATPGCCGSRSLVLRHDWSTPSDFADRFPPASVYPIIDSETIGAETRYFLQDFGPTSQSSGFITSVCQSMALGLRITVNLQPTLACSGDGCYAAVVLTGASSAVGGARLIDDLAIRMNARGEVQVTQSWPTTLVDWMNVGVTPGTETPIFIDVTPGQFSDGDAALVATITVHTSAGPVTVLDSRPFIALADLDRTGTACRAVPGLRIAVEGSGNSVRVHEVNTYGLECVNPSHFAANPDGDETLDHGPAPESRLNLGEWATGGMGSPALLSTCSNDECWRAGGLVRWDLFVEASNINLESEAFTHVGYSIDHASSTIWEDRDSWFSSEDSAPRLGENPPSCLDLGGSDTCDGNRSVRDPAVWAHRTDRGRLGLVGGLGSPTMYLAYAKERLPGSSMEIDRGNFAIHIDEIPEDPSLAVDPDDYKIDVDMHGLRERFGCISIRHPSISRATNVTEGLHLVETDFWMLYTCVRDSAPESILLSEFTSTFGYRSELTREILRPADLGPYAAGGVWGPEMVVDWSTDENRPRVRVWFMARSSDRRVSIGLMQGEGSEVVYPGPDMPPILYAFPELVEFTGNPVLDSSHEALWARGGIRLIGLAVTPMGNNSPVPGAQQHLRFLVARRVNIDGAWTTDLIPLGQAWRSP